MDVSTLYTMAVLASGAAALGGFVGVTTARMIRRALITRRMEAARAARQWTTVRALRGSL